MRDLVSRTDSAGKEKLNVSKLYFFAFELSIDVVVKSIYNSVHKKIMKSNKSSNHSYFSFPTIDVIKKFKKHNKAFALSDIFYYYH